MSLLHEPAVGDWQSVGARTGLLVTTVVNASKREKD